MKFSRQQWIERQAAGLPMTGYDCDSIADTKSETAVLFEQFHAGVITRERLIERLGLDPASRLSTRIVAKLRQHSAFTGSGESLEVLAIRDDEAFVFDGKSYWRAGIEMLPENDARIGSIEKFEPAAMVMRHGELLHAFVRSNLLDGPFNKLRRVLQHLVAYEMN
jgi:hypothetical protein